MLKKSKLILLLFFVLSLFLASEFTYLQNKHTLSNLTLEKKRAFVKLTGLPDLAIVNESRINRHRSLNTVANIYEIDGLLRESEKSTFVFNTASHL